MERDLCSVASLCSPIPYLTTPRDPLHTLSQYPTRPPPSPPFVPHGIGRGADVGRHRQYRTWHRKGAGR
eukprot:3435071-Rhodomonas_salina.1